MLHRLVNQHTLFLAATMLTFAATTIASEHTVQFDAPSSVALSPLELPVNSSVDSSAKSDDVLLRCKFRISAFIDTPTTPRIDQWIVTCRPRNSSMRIADYSPSTKVSSGIEGPIDVKITQESSRSYGGSIDGNYGKILHGHLGADHGSKRIESQQYQQTAPNNAVIASGTVDRGRGVYFKLRWTAEQVLEGEKEFELKFSVPPSWRTGLLDVQVVAQATASRFGGLDKETRVVGNSRFTLPVFRQGDREAAGLATQVAATEAALRKISENATRSNRPTSLPKVIRHVAAKLNMDKSSSIPTDSRWLKRLIAGHADPYTDTTISGLPIHIRVAAIDFHDARNQFQQIANSHGAR